MQREASVQYIGRGTGINWRQEGSIPMAIKTVSIARVNNAILLVRGQKVMLETGRGRYRNYRPFAAALERKSSKQFNLVFQAIRRLMAPPVASPRRIGF